MDMSLKRDNERQQRGSRRAATAGALICLVTLSGCWLDFRKFVTLQFDEHTETADWKKEQVEVLTSYGVVSEEAGLYRLPIASAISAVAADASLLEPVIELKTDLSDMSLAQQGEQHFNITYGCAACHSLEGQRKIGPALNQRWGKVALLEGDEEVTFDDEYFYESVYYSRKKIARGYPPAMPVFENVIPQEHYEAIKTYLTQYQ